MPTCLAVCTTTPSVPPDQSLQERRPRPTVFYEDIVRPACEQLGLTFLRADRLTEAGLPKDQLLRMLTEVEVVVTDLGEPDTELAFVLGARHALGRCTVHVTEGASRPAGFPTASHVSFPSCPEHVVTARSQLTSVLEAEAETLGETGSSDLPAGPASRPGAAAVAENDEDVPGLFDLIVEAEAEMEAIQGDMADVESAVEDLVEMVGLIGEDMARVNHPGASTNTKMAVVNRLAKAIDGPTVELEAAAGRFAERMGTGVGAFRAFLTWAEETPRSEWPQGAEDALEQIATSAWGTQAEMASFQEGLALINMIGSASRHLRRPARRVITSFQVIFQSVAVLEDLQKTAVALKRS
ncbi:MULTISPECIES: hypothetical protein [unclassified Streptomyces]|uniref:hypothetical protein n=1 Tax=unclassified Streptomyces TaxID=2593676 RepID=UPI0035D963AF